MMKMEMGITGKGNKMTLIGFQYGQEMGTTVCSSAGLRVAGGTQILAVVLRSGETKSRCCSTHLKSVLESCGCVSLGDNNE